MVKSNQAISIIIPTYNESENILKILKSIKEIVPKNIKMQTIVVDDNSPDGTGIIVDEYIKNLRNAANYTIDVIHRKTKEGLSSAVINGIKYAKGETIVVMDSDFSHPPQVIPKMIKALNSSCQLVVASRYINGGKISGWPIKRKLISKFATVIAKKGLGVKSNDPLSGFFAFKKNILNGIKIDGIGFKILLEILVKTKNVNILEIPYTFSDREEGSSKLDTNTIIDYCKSVWKLYRFGRLAKQSEKRKSVKFVSKAARFFSIGAIGLGVNYLSSLFFSSSLDMWYLHATILGILFSISSNFVLNKCWTFEDRDFSPKKTIIQYGKFVGFSSIGALAQLGMVYYLVDQLTLSYPIALVLAVGTAAFSNFILNKKWTFKEKLWE